MSFKLSGLKSALLAAAINLGAYEGASSQTLDSQSEIESGQLQIHQNMLSDPGVYARDIYLAYIKHPDENINVVVQAGLLSLAAHAYNRSSIEPAGIVALDPETDDLSLFPFIYWPVTDSSPRLSPLARQNIQTYMGGGGLPVIDIIDGTLASSDNIHTLLEDIQAGPFEIVEEGHLLTQSFYLTQDLPGVANRDVLAERIPEEQERVRMTSIIVSDQNWTAAWTGRSVGPDIHEDALRAGLNILSAAYMGTSKLDPIHLPTFDQKRDFQEEARLREEAESQVEGAAPSAP